MKPRLLALLCVPMLCATVARAKVPTLDHVIVIIMENHGYDEARTQPYTSKLMAQSATFTKSYAVTHPSFPNYLALWAGSTLGVTTDDCPPANAPWNAENLGHACEAAGITWRAYSEDLPSAGYTGCSAGGYRRKHAPWTDFSNLTHANERPYTDLAKDIAAGQLPALSFVVPNNCHNTHDCSLATGDAWLAANVPAMLKALGPHGLLILTWDEDDNGTGNHILTVFAGPTVKPDEYTTKITHYSVLRSICDSLGLAPMGAAASATPVDDIWTASAPVPRTWGWIKAAYRGGSSGAAPRPFSVGAVVTGSSMRYN